MGFILGLLIGLLLAVALIGFLAYWLCSRSNTLAVAKFINGIAQALAALRPKSSEPPSATRDGPGD